MPPPNHIENAVKSEGVSSSRLTNAERENCLAQLERKYSVSFQEMEPPWDTKNAPSVFRIDGWELAAEFVRDIEFFLIDKYGSDIWRVSNSDDLLRILGGCPPIDYYLTDSETSFLLCSNTHEYLVGWGRATDWILSLPESTPIN